MMIPRRRLVAMTAAAVAAMLVSACASSSQSGSGGNSDGTASGSPVKIMVTGVLATPSANYAESANGAQAAAAAINQAGAIDGHSLQIITCNDNLDPADAISCSRARKPDQRDLAEAAAGHQRHQTGTA
jgi:ABC-type branched-subunit amino acid transport system substrate-binding protein